MCTVLTKHLVARQQLVTAIRLLFDGADLISIYTLAANAWEVIDALATRAGVSTLSNQTRGQLPPTKDLKVDYINSPHRNFFKHADRDPDGTVPPLKQENVDTILYLAVEDYIRLYKKAPLELQVFQLWYLSRNRAKLSQDASSRLLEVIDSTLPYDPAESRADALLSGKNLLTSARGDKDLVLDVLTESAGE